MSRLFQSAENVKCWRISLKLIPWGPPSSLERERKLCRHSFTASSIKREIRHFHVVVVQRQQRKIQKSVMHVQSGCFAYSKPVAFLTSSLPLPLPFPSSMLSSLISAILQRSTSMSVHNLSQIKATGMAYLNGLHGSLCSERAFLH